jgi:gluconolactonase
VLADNYQGKRLNSPNDLACKSDGSLWFTDPPFGILSAWEGEPAAPEVPHGVYRIDPSGGALARVIEDLDGPNCANLCFGGAKMNRLFMASTHSLYALHVNARGAG